MARHLVAIVSLACILVPIVQGFCSDTATRYKYYDEFGGYIKLHVEPADWDTSRKICRDQGSTLVARADIVCPEKQEEKDLLARLIRTNLACKKARICYHDKMTRGSFYSIDGRKYSDLHYFSPVVKSNETEIWNSNNIRSFRNLALGGDGKSYEVPNSTPLPFFCFRKQVTEEECDDANPCPEGYEHYSALISSCYTFKSEKVLWMDASKDCASIGGYLAVVNSRKEAEYLANIAKAKGEQGNIHLGFLARVERFIKHPHVVGGTVWETIFGIPVNSTGYNDSDFKPDNNETTFDCGALAATYKLTNSDCNKEHLPYICEKPIC